MRRDWSNSEHGSCGDSASCLLASRIEIRVNIAKFNDGRQRVFVVCAVVGKVNTCSLELLLRVSMMHRLVRNIRNCRNCC